MAPDGENGIFHKSFSTRITPLYSFITTNDSQAGRLPSPSKDPLKEIQQAKGYADCQRFEVKYVFATNAHRYGEFDCFGDLEGRNIVGGWGTQQAIATSVTGTAVRSAARNKISLITLEHASASTQIGMVNLHCARVGKKALLIRTPFKFI